MKKKIKIVKYPIKEKYCLRNRVGEQDCDETTTCVHRIEHQDEAGEWQVLIEKIEPLLKDLGIFYGGSWQYNSDFGLYTSVPDTFLDFEGSMLRRSFNEVDRKHGLADILLRDEKTLDFVFLSIDNSGHVIKRPYETWEWTGKYVAWRGYSAVPETKLKTGVKKYIYATFDFCLRSLDLDTLNESYVGTSTFCKYEYCKIHKRNKQVDTLAELTHRNLTRDLEKNFDRHKTREYTVSYDCFEKLKDFLSLADT